MSELLSLRDVSISFSGRQVLSHIDLTLEEGEICTVIGPNGAGKSTLVKIVTELLEPESGIVKRRPDLRVGYVPQRLRIDTSMPLRVERFLRLADSSSSNRHAVLERMGICHLHNSQLNELSGGELQRVLIARAMLRRPQLMVLDEPLQGVDVNGQAELYRLIATLREELHCAIMMVSHDLHLVMAQTDSVVCLNQHICCHGKPDSVSRHPEYLRLFGSRVADQLAVYTHHHDHQHNLHGDVVDNAAAKVKNHSHD